MAERKYRILLAEDDLNLGFLLVEYLDSEGFDVKLCKDGEMAFNAFKSNDFDLCLLDVMLPRMDGFSLAGSIRASNRDIPLLFISAKALKEDKLKAYGLGADDYITKPFDEEELVWKLKAVVRRLNNGKSHNDDPLLNIGSYVFDYKNQTLKLGSEIKRITVKEAEVLHYLCNHKNKVIKREEMLVSIWGKNDYFLGRSLDVFITKIRKYLKEDPGIRVENVFGVGFEFHVPEEGIK